MLGKILNIRKTNYTSDLNEENLKKKVEAIFAQGTLSFVGRFSNKSEFTAYDKLRVVAWHMPNFKRKSAYLKGEIIKLEKGVLLKVHSNPNVILSIFALLSVLIGAAITLAAESIHKNKQFFLIGCILIIVGILYYFVGRFLRNRLQKNFEQYLGLPKMKL
ncbi:hypothetical protein [Flavicella sediminum]|uniref:hypothetical protein n=1 Tax=Flavicella sediminum TaxID=2585141 RepID=UPI0011206BB9|nr:hypothetical protein [Flavicella sediminum]